ncbi:hypothetical protein BRCON_0700 [Candidatus Sumerlaea chitinivorans]|uniref:Uncharacterized protein n=1 Tax=Sumerlaea chitinivorans TaxID=2250252 RepID=A0A2Z4Y2N6_SUMC1|nr:hypothetical protein BRCON_0700 [Candidatus Sumerlaea chitinivorans]
MMTANKGILILGLAVLLSGCAYNSRTHTFELAWSERPVKPPAYPIPDLSPASPSREATNSIPPPAEQ